MVYTDAFGVKCALRHTPGWLPSPIVVVDAPFRFPVTVRYLEVDAQGVVFNMWYLAWFDEAMTAYLAHGGYPYAELMADGLDVMLVRSEIDWSDGVGFGDDVAVLVTSTRVGQTSFTLRFEVTKGGAISAVGTTTYVVVGIDGSGKRPVPDRLRAALP
jgi:acyl-CoA thioester hydrolase